MRTDPDFVESVHAIAAGLSSLCEKKGFAGPDVANLASAALVELLADKIGLVAAVERLRTLADICERELFH